MRGRARATPEDRRNAPVAVSFGICGEVFFGYPFHVEQGGSALTQGVTAGGLSGKHPVMRSSEPLSRAEVCDNHCEDGAMVPVPLVLEAAARMFFSERFTWNRWLRACATFDGWRYLRQVPRNVFHVEPVKGLARTVPAGAPAESVAMTRRVPNYWRKMVQLPLLFFGIRGEAVFLDAFHVEPGG